MTGGEDIGRAIDVLQHQPHLIGLGRAEIFIFDAGQASLFLVRQVFRVFAPKPLTLMESFPHALTAQPNLGAPDLVHRFAGVFDHMKLVEHHLGVAAHLRDSGLIGLAHVHARLRDGMPMSIVLFQRLHEFHPRFPVLAFGGKDHALGQQIGEHTVVFMALAHAHLIDANAAGIAEVRLGISSIHLPKEHAPQPRVRFTHQLAHLAHGHLAHQQQREGFKLLGEVGAQPLPRRAHSE